MKGKFSFPLSLQRQCHNWCHSYLRFLWTFWYFWQSRISNCDNYSDLIMMSDSGEHYQLFSSNNYENSKFCREVHQPGLLVGVRWAPQHHPTSLLIGQFHRFEFIAGRWEKTTPCISKKVFSHFLQEGLLVQLENFVSLGQ